MRKDKKKTKIYRSCCVFLLYLFCIDVMTSNAYQKSRDEIPEVIAGINLNLNQTPKEFRLSKQKFRSATTRKKAVKETLKLYESWVEAFRVYQKIGEPDYEKGEVFSTVWDTEARFELSVMGYYCGFLMSRLYREYDSYSSARNSEDYYLYLQAVYCFLSTNNVCFHGTVTGDPKSIHKAEFSGMPVYESFYSADYKRLDNLHGPHSQPIRWFDDAGIEKTKAVWASANHTKGSVGSDFNPKEKKHPVFGLSKSKKKQLKKLSLKKLPECMKLKNTDPRFCETRSANYIDISDVLKSQHSNFQDGTTQKDRAYTELLEAAVQVFQYLGVMSKTCSNISEYKKHELYPYYLNAAKCFSDIDQKCFAGKFGKNLQMDELGYEYRNLFRENVKKVKKGYPCKKPDRLDVCVWLADYALR